MKSVTKIKCGQIVTRDKIWQVWVNVTSVAKYDKYDKIWQMWQNLTSVTKCDKKLQVWQNMASVTNCDKCEKKSQRNRTEMKGDKFEGVRQV